MNDPRVNRALLNYFSLTWTRVYTGPSYQRGNDTFRFIKTDRIGVSNIYIKAYYKPLKL